MYIHTASVCGKVPSLARPGASQQGKISQANFLLLQFLSVNFLASPYLSCLSSYVVVLGYPQSGSDAGNFLTLLLRLWFTML